MRQISRRLLHVVVMTLVALLLLLNSVQQKQKLCSCSNNCAPYNHDQLEMTASSTVPDYTLIEMTSLSVLPDNHDQPGTTSPSPSVEHKYKLVVGILTAKRNQSTVVKMAQDLAQQVSNNEYKLVIWVSFSASKDENLVSNLSTLNLTVIVNERKYTELAKDRVRITFHDPLDRVLWRTSHVLDYANLLEASLSYNTDYVLILEDDLKPAKYALDKAYEYARQVDTQHNNVALFTNGLTRFPGACALMMERPFATDFVSFLRSDPYEAPVDLLFGRFSKTHEMKLLERKPNLFQHISHHSSYTGRGHAIYTTERTRSASFMYDEDNTTLASIPAGKDGYIGCFKDSYDRDMSGLYLYSGVSQQKCRSRCEKYLYFGLQNGDECYCGNEFGQFGWAPSSECNMACRLNKSATCGGKFRNSVYRVKIRL